jgi:hypothetical protein
VGILRRISNRIVCNHFVNILKYIYDAFEDLTYLIIAFAVFAALNVVTIRDILKNKNLSKDKETITSGCSSALPIIGSIIYFSEKVINRFT